MFLVMLYFYFPMSTGAHSDSTEVLLMPVCASWQHTAIHPGSGEQLLRSYPRIWQQAVPMSPSKQQPRHAGANTTAAFSLEAEEGSGSKSYSTGLSSGAGCISLRLTPLHLSSSWDRWHMDILMLLATLPEVTAFYSPSKLGVVPGSTVDSSHPLCLWSSLALCCALTLCGRTPGATLPASEPWDIFLQ